MIFSTNSFNRVGLIFFSGLLALSGCKTTQSSLKGRPDVVEKQLPIAVLPFENLSGTAAPLKEIRESLIDALEARGLNILEEKALARFMKRRRMRYTGGIDRPTARAISEETGSEAVLISSLELYRDSDPPKIGFSSRLVSSGEDPAVLWIDGVGLAGDDSPGLLELGLIRDPRRLLEKSVGLISNSLAQHLSGSRGGPAHEAGKRRFKPKLFYRSPVIDPSGQYTVAVTPFFNESARKKAGEIMLLHFVKRLKDWANLSVIEPGVVRRELLRLRIVMDEGVSLAQADLIFHRLDADLILTGKVFDYEDPQRSIDAPRVDFSAVVIEKKSRQVVWASKSYNQGDDRVFFFDWGRVGTAHAMASEMARAALEVMLE